MKKANLFLCVAMAFMLCACRNNQENEIFDSEIPSNNYEMSNNSTNESSFNESQAESELYSVLESVVDSALKSALEEDIKKKEQSSSKPQSSSSSKQPESPYQSMINEYEKSLTTPKEHDSNYYRDGAFYNLDKFSIFVEVKQAFSGDTYNFGVYDNDAKKWVVPMNSNLEICDAVYWADMIKNCGKGTGFIGGYKMSYIGNNTIYCTDHCKDSGWDGGKWCYNFVEDKFFKLGNKTAEHAQGSTIIAQSEYGLYTLNIDDNSMTTFFDDGAVRQIFDTAFLARNRWGGDYRLYDYNGNLLFNLPENSYDISSETCDYDGKHLIVCADGKDSGKYAIIFDNSGSMVCEPIAYESVTSRFGTEKETMLFDTFFTIANFPMANYYDRDAGTVYFYDYSGKLLTKYKTKSEEAYY